MLGNWEGSVMILLMDFKVTVSTLRVITSSYTPGRNHGFDLRESKSWSCGILEYLNIFNFNINLLNFIARSRQRGRLSGDHHVWNTATNTNLFAAILGKILPYSGKKVEFDLRRTSCCINPLPYDFLLNFKELLFKALLVGTVKLI